MIDNGEEVRSQARRTYLTLRDLVILGDLAPLARLKIADLAMEFGVSPGAVREALSRLTTDRLVEARDQRGFRVAPVSLADLDDLTETRIQIEGLAMAQAIQRGDAAWETALRESHDALARRTPGPGDIEGAVLHGRFHDALVAGCGSPHLLGVRRALYDLAERYRFLAIQRAAAPRPVADEHAAITAAALARRPTEAIAALSNHIRLTTRLVREALGQK